MWRCIYCITILFVWLPYYVIPKSSYLINHSYVYCINIANDVFLIFLTWSLSSTVDTFHVFRVCLCILEGPDREIKGKTGTTCCGSLPARKSSWKKTAKRDQVTTLPQHLLPTHYNNTCVNLIYKINPPIYTHHMVYSTCVTYVGIGLRT